MNHPLFTLFPDAKQEALVGEVHDETNLQLPDLTVNAPQSNNPNPSFDANMQFLTAEPVMLLPTTGLAHCTNYASNNNNNNSSSNLAWTVTPTDSVQRSMTTFEAEHKIAMALPLPPMTAGVTVDAMIESLDVFPVLEHHHHGTMKPDPPPTLDEDHRLLDSPGRSRRRSIRRTTKNSSNRSPPTKRQRTVKSPTHRRTSWEERLQQLQDYKSKHGDLLIPIRFKDNPSLGKFVHNTREQYKLFHRAAEPGKTKKCSLTVRRIEQLEDIGFLWSAERSKHQKEDWEARVKQLQEYKDVYGDCLVPHGYNEDVSFGEWVHRQRTTYAHMVKEEHPNPLIVARMKQLDDLGFHFTVHADKWMEHWKELQAYKRLHGNCDCPTHCPDNLRLGRWVHTQRHQRRLKLKGQKKSCMTEERVALLDSLGFSWEVRSRFEQTQTASGWHQQFHELKQFVGQYHHHCVPVDIMPELRAWCSEQKQRLQFFYQQQEQHETLMDGSQLQSLSLEQAEALEGIGFTKDVHIGTEPYASSDHNAPNHDLLFEQNSEHPDFGEALDAMIAVYDHPEVHVSSGAAGVPESPDCTLQTNANGDIFAQVTV